MRGIYLFHVWDHASSRWILSFARANRNGGPDAAGIPRHVEGLAASWTADPLSHSSRVTFVGDDGYVEVIKDAHLRPLPKIASCSRPYVDNTEKKA